MENKKERLLNAVWMWALSEGMDEIAEKEYTFGADRTFKKADKFYGFITEPDRSSEELKSKTDSLKCFYDYIYIVTNDRNKKKYIEENSITGVGIICDSNPFGLGQLFEVLKEAELLNQLK